MTKNLTKLLLFLLLPLSVLTCKNTEETSEDDFILIPRGSYFRGSVNGISVYRDAKTRNIMNGYYVVEEDFQKWEEFEVKNGILNGDYKIYHSNGNIYAHGIYKNGKLHGKSKTYYPGGELKSVEHFANGKHYGKKITFYENGSLKKESQFNDEEVVESVTYDAIGGIQEQMFIKNGRAITQHIQSGIVFMENISSTYDNFEAIKYYNTDGSLKAFVRMLEDGDKSFMIELDENENEINRIDVKAHPMQARKFMQSIFDESKELKIPEL